MVLAGLVDYATHGFPPATDREFQRKGFTVLRPPTYYGPAVLPNYARIPALRNKVARQALLYAVDREQSGAVGEGKSGFLLRLWSGRRGPGLSPPVWGIYDRKRAARWTVRRAS